MTELRTYVSLSHDLRSGKVTPRAYLEECLDRIAKNEPRIGAFVALNAEGARKAADASSARWRDGRPLSAIDGMPIDPEFARTTPYGTTIAHGCIVGAVVSRYLVERMGFENRVRSVRLKFIGPVRSGDSLQCVAEPEDDGAAAPGVRTYKVSCSNQKGEIVAVGTAAISDEARA